jgi:hypothetical protein
MAHLALDVLPNRQILMKEAGELLLGVPVSLPVMDDAEPHASGMNFLTHLL